LKGKTECARGRHGVASFLIWEATVRGYVALGAEVFDLRLLRQN
jgi:hypothetical protein